MTIKGWFEDISPVSSSTDPQGDPVRFALIGLGWFTVDAALPSIGNVPGCRATVAVSSSKEKAEALVADHDTLEQALTYDAFHEGEGIDAYDALYIGTPNGYHLPFVETARRYEKAVLCEKPMEATLDRARSIVELWVDASEPLMVAYRMQADPLIQQTRAFVQAGGIGTPKHALGEMSQPLTENISSDPNQWRLDPDISGGSALIDLGIYPVNTLRYLLDADPVTVRGTTVSQADLFSEVDEYVSFELRFENDVTAACVASQNAQESDLLRLVGTEGRIEIDPAFFGEVEVSIDRSGESVSFRNDEIDQLEEEFRLFSSCVRSGQTPDASAEHGLVDMRTIDAIYEAARTGRAIDVS